MGYTIERLILDLNSKPIHKKKFARKQKIYCIVNVSIVHIYLQLLTLTSFDTITTCKLICILFSRRYGQKEQDCYKEDCWSLCSHSCRMSVVFKIATL